jgi:hypothetical protein
MYIGDAIYGLPSVSSNWNGDYINFSGKLVGNEVSLYQFLLNNSDVYNTKYFTVKKHLNYVGL